MAMISKEKSKSKWYGNKNRTNAQQINKRAVIEGGTLGELRPCASRAGVQIFECLSPRMYIFGYLSATSLTRVARDS
jgi:hypothetical protein